MVVFKANSPLLGMVFERPEIAGLHARAIASINTLTILYDSRSMVVSVLVWLLIRKNLMAGDAWAFWVLLAVIGFIDVMADIASAPISLLPGAWRTLVESASPKRVRMKERDGTSWLSPGR